MWFHQSIIGTLSSRYATGHFHLRNFTPYKNMLLINPSQFQKFELHIFLITRFPQLHNFSEYCLDNNAQNNFNISPLHIALRKYSKMIRIGNETKAEKFREIIELILSTFHNLQCQDFDGNTALHIAVEDNLIEIVKKLVPFYQNLEIENKLGYTPYMSAKFHKHFAIIDFLNVELKKRVDLE